MAATQSTEENCLTDKIKKKIIRGRDLSLHCRATTFLSLTTLSVMKGWHAQPSVTCP